MGSKTLIVSTLVLTFLAAATGAFAQARPTFPIAYISIQKILTEAEDAKAAAKELEALRAARTQDLNTRKQALDATKLEIANAGGIFSASKRTQLTELARRQESELQQATQQAQADFQELQKKVQERLRSELTTIITALATQRGVPYVLNQDAAIVLAPKGTDWTAEVLQKLNAAAAQRAASEKAAAEKAPNKP